VRRNLLPKQPYAVIHAAPIFTYKRWTTDGKLEWPELTAIVGAALVYIGPDTAITHLAAATGTPTVSLYGPTDPRIWGPWPVGGLDRLVQAAASTVGQQIGAA
jgi:ADP-heptose:LPS heptosyltransferase